MLSLRSPQPLQVLAAGAVLGAGSLARELRRLDRQVKAYRRFWEQHNLATLRRLKEDSRPGEDPLVVVAMGDSATQGIGARSWDLGYVPLLAKAIGDAQTRPVEILNLSASGATIESVLATQHPGLLGLGLKPDVTVVNIGGNDVWAKHLDEQKFRAYAKELSESLPPGALMGNIPSFSFLPQDERAGELSAILDEEAGRAGHSNVDLRALSQQVSAWEYMVRYHAADLFHPNGRAYAAWAKEFFSHWERNSAPL